MASHKSAALLLCLGVAMVVSKLLSGVVGALPQPSSGCQRKCGDVDIPYPFGLTPECAMEGLELSCKKMDNDDVYKPFYDDVEVLNISLHDGQTTVMNHISSHCYNATTKRMEQTLWELNLMDTPFIISDAGNMFTVIGCRTLAYIGDEDEVGSYTSGCVAMCREDDLSLLGKGSCSGRGCCQTAIPREMKYYQAWFDNNIRSTNHCNYAVVLDSSSFTFSSSYVSSSEFINANGGQAPLLLDWAIGNETCDAAHKTKPSSYACAGDHSECFNSLNGPGYICNCSKGFHGNPYLQDPEEGCKDIDECKDQVPYPCSVAGTCRNKVGGFECVCPEGTNGNAMTGTCQPYSSLGRGVTIGLSSGGGFLFLAAAVVMVVRRWKKAVQRRLRSRHFRRNKGMLLEQLVSSDPSASDGTKIFSMEELERSTNNFDRSRVVGRGGHGTVYKGILTDQRVVAIKVSKLVARTEIDQFINEVTIMSQINHRNVVKLHGCCLEAEVPLLVYEFVSGGTLYELLRHEHDGGGGPARLPWEERLRIATEVAGALTYLHSEASVSILHRDIKSMNVLVNSDSHTAKVSDFGASRSIPIDQTHVVTAVQGTFGYLDPEYYHTSQLTDKSDVYSFGVILVELLTRKKPIIENDNGEKQNLSNYFLCAMAEEKPLNKIVDAHILEEGNEEAVEDMAGLARDCLSLRRHGRPTMKDVEMRLQNLRVREVTLRMVTVVRPQRDEPPAAVQGGDTRQYSLEQEFLSSQRMPR